MKKRFVAVLFLLAVASTASAGQPNNDDCDSAEIIGALPYTVVEPDIEEATNDFSDPFPFCTGFAREHTVWWQYTPATDHWITVSTAGSDFDTFLRIVAGACGGSELGCADDGAVDGNAEITTGLQGGVTYTILAGAVTPIVDGELHLSAQTAPTPPAGTLGDETWTAAGSPYTFITDFTIHPGHTVTMEPGAVVELQNGARLYVEGTLTGSGTDLSPIVVDGLGRVVVRGTVQLDHTTFRVRVEPDGGSSMTVLDSRFEGYGELSNWGSPTYTWNLAPFVRVERTVFDGGSFLVGASHTVVRDVTVLGDWADFSGFPVIDGLAIDGSPYQGLGMAEFGQPVWIDNVTVTNSAGAGLQLVAGNFLIGENVVLQNNLYPLEMGGVGILGGSVLPGVGNVNNYISVDSFSNAVARMTWTDPGIPYVIEDSYNGGTLEILEGVTVKLKPNATFWGEPGFIDVRGMPSAPVTFERFDPAQSWQGLQYFHRYENAIIDGGQVGARFHSATFPGYLDNCIVRNNDFGSQNDAIARKTRFLNNTVGTWDSNWPESMSSQTNPNGFSGNTVAVEAVGSVIDARYSWWGHPSGATAPDNPGGSGDAVSGPGVSTVPFLTAEPEWSDSPPVVRLHTTTSVVEPYTSVIISWTSTDDQAVSSHRIEFDHPLEGTTVLASDLPGTQQAFHWEVPDVGVIVNNVRPRLRVVAVDSSGQEGWDEHRYLIPVFAPTGQVVVTTELSGTYRAGDEIGELCWEETELDPYTGITAGIQYDGGLRSEGLGGTFQPCLSLDLQAPFVSTDTARIVLSSSDGLNRLKVYYDDYFTIRPDVRTGDEPPSVTLLSPAGGTSLVAGTTVPISWQATDDQGIRRVDLQASYDGGRTWHFFAEDLPGTTTAFDWHLPPGNGITDVRVRVIVSDLRFQTSSDTTAIPLEITSSPTGCTGVPGEVQQVAHAAAELSWSPLAGAEWYEIARAVSPGLPATCMGNVPAGTSWTDPETPSTGAVFFYLLRGANACGAGTWGSATSGATRTTTCP